MEKKPVLVGLKNGRVIALSIDTSNEERLSFIENGCDSVILMPENSDVPDFKSVYEIKFVDKSPPEGFVLVPKDELTTTYYWEGAEHTVNCVSEYEMELEKGEIAELEKWEQTKSTKAFFANIYSDEDNFEIVEFDSIKAAQQAIKENKAMIEAQEQKKWK